MGRSNMKLVKLLVMAISILSKRHLLYACATAIEKSIINSAVSWKAIHKQFTSTWIMLVTQNVAKQYENLHRDLETKVNFCLIHQSVTKGV